MLVFVRNAVLQYMQICQARSCPSLLHLWQVGMPCRRDQYWTDILASCYPILSFSLSLLAQNLTFSQIAFTMDSLTFLRLTVCTLDSYSYHFFWACRVLFFLGGGISCFFTYSVCIFLFDAEVTNLGTSWALHSHLLLQQVPLPVGHPE